MKIELFNELKELSNMRHGLLLAEYIEDEIEKIKNISTIKGVSNEEIAMIVLSRQEAEKVLRNILGVITPRVERKIRNQYQ
jgi:hypothetical protein